MKHLNRVQKLDDALVIKRWPVSATHLAELIALIDEGVISGKIAKTVFEEMVVRSRSDTPNRRLRIGQIGSTLSASPRAIVAEKGLTQVSDEGLILAAIDQVLAANAAKVEEYRGGKDKLFGFFVGQVMKATGGKANPALVNEILKKRLAG